MHLGKFFKLMVFVTVLALAYIHMQMQIIDLAYRGQYKEQRIKRLFEENGNASYKILMLKSANHLGGAMLEEDSGMRFADSNDVVQIAASEDFLTEENVQQASQLAKKTNSLIGLFSVGVEAEAKAAK